MILHRRRWSLEDEAVILYGICTHTVYDGWLWGQRLTVCPVMYSMVMSIFTNVFVTGYDCVCLNVV